MASRLRLAVLFLALLAPALAGADYGCRGYSADHARWFDRAHGFFSERACAPAVWFDRFFGDEREDDVASAFVRVIPAAQYSDREGYEYGTRFKARVSLPGLKEWFANERFDLVVDDTGDDGELLPDEAVRPGPTPDLREETSAALRYLVRLRDNSRLDVDVGLRSQLRFFTRLRYSTTWEHSPLLQTRYTQSFYFLDGDGFGETSLIEVERILRKDTLLRWSTQATVSELANGLALREGVRLLRQLDADRALSWGVATGINSDPVWQANTYSTSVRYRQRILRPWLFYEVEPYLDWVRSDGFNTNPGVAVRVEIWFGDSSRPREPRATDTAAATAGPAAEPAPPAVAEPVTSPTSVDPVAAPAASQ